jgi:hypothetical protein
MESEELRQHIADLMAEVARLTEENARLRRDLDELARLDRVVWQRAEQAEAEVARLKMVTYPTPRERELEARLAEWEGVFGHLSRDPNEAGTILDAARSRLEARLDAARALVNKLRREIKHVSAGGIGWVVRDGAKYYLICWTTPCSTGRGRPAVWTHCEFDQVGAACCECGAGRS